MLRKSSIRFLGVFLLAAALLIAAPAVAFDDLDEFGGLDDLGGDPFGGDTIADPGATASENSSPLGLDPSLTEQEQVDSLATRHKFVPENSKKDPFKPIVEKKVVLPPSRPKVSRPSTPSQPAPPPVQPIRLFVAGIVGNEANRMAVVKFENNEYTLMKDQVVEGKFKVVDILTDRVVVYSNQEQRRHTFRIGGDTK